MILRPPGCLFALGQPGITAPLVNLLGSAHPVLCSGGIDRAAKMQYCKYLRHYGSQLATCWLAVCAGVRRPERDRETRVPVRTLRRHPSPRTSATRFAGKRRPVAQPAGGS
jgi:hypothetical protein